MANKSRLLFQDQEEEQLEETQEHVSNAWKKATCPEIVQVSRKWVTRQDLKKGNHVANVL